MNHDNSFALQEILLVMYCPPSEIYTFQHVFTSREDEPMCPLHYLVSMHTHLVVMYIHTLNISEDCIMEL